MAVSLLLLAIIGGIVVGDLVVENTVTDELIVFNQTVTGQSKGVLLAMAAALGLVTGLLIVASANSTRAGRPRRRDLRTAIRDLENQVAELEGENESLWDELARHDSTAAYSSQPARPVDLSDRRAAPVGRAGPADDLGRDHRTNRTDRRGHVVRLKPVERQREPLREPLYEETKRVTRLRSGSDLDFLPSDEYGA
jgi:hypothetical protein